MDGTGISYSEAEESSEGEVLGLSRCPELGVCDLLQPNDEAS
jgi:hypothetical protein